MVKVRLRPLLVLQLAAWHHSDNCVLSAKPLLRRLSPFFRGHVPAVSSVTACGSIWASRCHAGSAAQVEVLPGAMQGATENSGAPV